MSATSKIGSDWASTQTDQQLDSILRAETGVLGPEAVSAAQREFERRGLHKAGRIVTEKEPIFVPRVKRNIPLGAIALWVLSFVLFALAVAVIDLVIVSGQYLYHYKDTARLHTESAVLANKRQQIKEMENLLGKLESEIAAERADIDVIHKQIQQLEASYPAGIPQSIYPSYTKAIFQHNTLVIQSQHKIDSYDQLHQQYSENVTLYNEMALRTAQLERKIAETKYLYFIPIPGVGTQRSQRQH